MDSKKTKQEEIRSAAANNHQKFAARLRRILSELRAASEKAQCRIIFTPNTDKLTKESKDVVEKLAKVFKEASKDLADLFGPENPSNITIHLQIEGHTYNRNENADYNRGRDGPQQQQPHQQ